MEANALKTIVILIYTFFVLAIFAYQGLINWEVGIIMAIGQSLGGYLTAAYASNGPILTFGHTDYWYLLLSLQF